MFKNLKKKSTSGLNTSSLEITSGNGHNFSKTNLDKTENDKNNFNFSKPNSRNKSKNKKVESAIEEEFLDEVHNFSDAKKTEDILKKFCTLYKDEEMEMENNFSFNPIKNQENNLGKYCIKSLNYDHQQKKIRMKENLLTTGPDWFNMKAPELTPELREDLKALQLKNIIDPSRFYKKSDSKKLPKFFQVGRIMDNITEGKKYRLKKSEVKNRMAEEILETDLAKNYSVRKFEELQTKKRKLGIKKMKINKYKLKNKKFSGKKDFIFK